MQARLTGTPWRVYSNLLASETLVIPRATTQGPADPAGWRDVRAYGIVITGVHYYVNPDADDEGFDLFVDDDNFVEGATVSHPLVTVRTAGAAVPAALSIKCYCPLSRGDAIGTPSRGASLRVALNGTPAAGSFLWVEGVHTGADLGRYCNTGSPINGFASTQPS